MGLFSRKQSTAKFPWIPLETETEMESVIEQSLTRPVLLFKHSTRCSISSMALSRFENHWDTTIDCQCYFLDLITFRSVSNYVAEKTGVVHQSPQCILMFKGKVIHHSSHNGIDAAEIASLLNNTNSNE